MAKGELFRGASPSDLLPGPVDPMPGEPRVYTCYPLITFFAMDDQEAADKIHALDAYINGLDGTSTELTEECYRMGYDNQDPDEGAWAVPESSPAYRENNLTTEEGAC